MNKSVYTVREVAGLMGLSFQTVVKLFGDEPDVIVIARPSTNKKRRYRSIRIPARVYERVVRRLSN